MSGKWGRLGALMLGTLAIIGGCVQEIDRPGVTSPTATSTVPISTEAATPTPLPILIPTPTTTPESTEGPSIISSPTPTSAVELFLEILGPADGSSIRSNAVIVFGDTVSDATVTVGGIQTSVDQNGRFQAAVALSVGANVIEVVATDDEGTRMVSVLTLNALPLQGFLLLITEPEEQSIVSENSVRVAGRTGPNAVVSVRGVGVAVDELGFFSTTVTLNPGPNIIDIVATNLDGRVLDTVLAVIYRQ